MDGKVIIKGEIKGSRENLRYIETSQINIQKNNFIDKLIKTFKRKKKSK
jgi:hypothetical protein